MSLEALPEEILVIIIQYLDTKSVSNLYYTNKYFRHILSLKGVVKKCQMTRNNLATVQSFQTDFFKDIAANLLELNLCGMPDLRKSYLIPAMKKMKSLQCLDISYTYLNLLDFLDIYKACPTIINVSVNFMIQRHGLSKMPDYTIVQCQEMFGRFKHVHFIGSATNLLYSKLALLLLQEAELDTLKYSIAESDRLHTIYVPEMAEHTTMVKFKQFFLCFLDWTTVYAFYGSFFMLPVLSMTDINTVEAIIIIKRNFKDYFIHVTSLFENYFQDNFEVAADKIYVTEYKDAIIGNAAIMIWSKEYNTFDDCFFGKLKKLLKPYFPCDCKLYRGSSVPNRYEWFFLTPTPPSKTESNYEPPPKRMQLRKTRVAPANNVLNYDELFKTKEKVQLTLIFEKVLKNPIALPENCDYLAKLTFISISGSVRFRFSADFFNILFKSCINLVTANIESSSVSSCSASISRAIHMSPQLKNIRLTDNQIDFKTLFKSLAVCKTLENVHVVEESAVENTDIGDPSIIFDECPNLYNLFIEAAMSESVRVKKTQLLQKAKMTRQKPHINIVLHVKSDIHRIFYSYHPFLGVYKLNPIKEIKYSF